MPFNIHLYCHANESRNWVAFSLKNKRDKAKELLRIKMDLSDFNELVAGTTCWYLKKETQTSAHYMRRLLILDCGKHTTPMIHREIASRVMDLPAYDNTLGPELMVTDHINRDPLDNRAKNLRVITQRENSQNRDSCTPGNIYRGISYCFLKKRELYQSYYNKIYIGSSVKEELLHKKIDLFLESKKPKGLNGEK